ncbi:MAG: thymidylate synthase, partial [Patescibacteria group bacterium]
VDTMLGLPFNIASYAVLLHLLAKEANLQEGKLIGFLADTHIYVNHVEGAKEQLTRTPKALPRIKTDNFTSIFDWTYEQTTIEGYDPDPKIDFPIAV